MSCAEIMLALVGGALGGAILTLVRGHHRKGDKP